ncbi:hypothetical protein CDL62_15795 [Alkalitalea saponilacus]|nr:hypothetical protein CDL62_15795 [Alkalitalea saponilacus]
MNEVVFMLSIDFLIYGVQRVAIWHEAECGLRLYLPLQNLMRGRKVQKTTKPAFCYIACCG